MFDLAVFSIISLACALAYRLRGGGWFTLTDWLCRLIWGTSLFAAYIASHTGSAVYAYAVWLWALAYLSMLIPHGYCMNMGRWASPHWAWPSFFMPAWSQAQWTAMPTWCRTFNDFVDMAAVALWRSVLVFSPLALIAFELGHPVDYTGILCAVGILTIGQPFGYLIGWWVPFSIGNSLEKHSICWGEFFNGLVWGIAMVQL